MAVAWHLSTPASAPGAVAIVSLTATDPASLDGFLENAGIHEIIEGRAGLRDLLGIDRGLVARFSPRLAQLMPHGGIAVVRALVRELERRGASPATGIDPGAAFPEARGMIDARALATIGRAASPAAIDLLLAQHDLWSRPGAASDPARDAMLRRLIDPPLAVAMGAPNIGKSSLMNSLAGRAASIVADEPGTTRDHVGVLLELGGIVIRFVDTPGLRPDAGEIERRAQDLALGVARNADLVLLCADATAPAPSLEGQLARGTATIMVALRADLGPSRSQAAHRVSVREGRGVVELAAAMREALVPAAMLDAQTPWKFW